MFWWGDVYKCGTPIAHPFPPALQVDMVAPMAGRKHFAMVQHKQFVFVLGQKKWAIWLFLKPYLICASGAKTRYYA